MAAAERAYAIACPGPYQGVPYWIRYGPLRAHVPEWCTTVVTDRRPEATTGVTLKFSPGSHDLLPGWEPHPGRLVQWMHSVPQLGQPRCGLRCWCQAQRLLTCDVPLLNE